MNGYNYNAKNNKFMLLINFSSFINYSDKFIW